MPARTGKMSLLGRMTAALLCSLLLAAPAAPAPQNPAAPPALALADFQAEMERLAGALGETAGDAAAVEGLRQSLPEKWVVATGAGEVTVPSARLARDLERLALLERWEATRDLPGRPPLSPREDEELKKLLEQKLIAERLRALLGSQLAATAAQAAELASAADPAPLETARARLEEILRSGDFAQERKATWLDRLRARIGMWVSEVMERVFRLLPGLPEGGGQLIFWGLVAMVFCILALVTLRWLQRTSRRAAFVVEPGPALPRAWRDWMRDAVAAARRQDHREALRCLYWAAVCRLAESGAWQMDSARTPREYLRLLSLEHAHRRPLAALTERFEVTWYGYQEAREEDFRLALEELEKLGCPLDSIPAIAGS